MFQSQLGGIITTGGGFSTYNPIPSWQKKAVANYFSSVAANMPSPGYNVQGRAIPDVSFIGVAYQVVVGGGLASLYGTSASAPVFAAMSEYFHH